MIWPGNVDGTTNLESRELKGAAQCCYTSIGYPGSSISFPTWSKKSNQYNIHGQHGQSLRRSNTPHFSGAVYRCQEYFRTRYRACICVCHLNCTPDSGAISSQKRHVTSTSQLQYSGHIVCRPEKPISQGGGRPIKTVLLAVVCGIPLRLCLS